MKRILLLGDTGKMGTAIKNRASDAYEIVGYCSSNLNVENIAEVEQAIIQSQPSIVINTVAMLGLDNCENNPQKAMNINTLLPRFLAELSGHHNYELIHFSTDSVFNNDKQSAYIESDIPIPLNVYGSTKYSADCLIQALSDHYYILRIGIMFGPSGNHNQFTEKMINKMKAGETIRIADDVVTSPCYSLDVASQLFELIENKNNPYGVYHVANRGSVSLYTLMKKFADILGVKEYLLKGSHNDFNCYAIKNTNTPIASEKIDTLKMWDIAVEEYCRDYLLKG